MKNTKAPEEPDLIPPTSPLLNKYAKEVAFDEIGSESIQNIINRMVQLATGKGHSKQDSRQMVGLAAIQIGVAKQIILIDTTADGSNKQQHLQVVINPKLTKMSKTTVQGREGCWSCGNICGIVERAKHVTLEGFDRNGKPIRLELESFVARIAQHEVDHLNGIRFPDRIPADMPERLHWVEPAEFEEYRQNWMHWPKLCPRERWEALKAGLGRMSAEYIPSAGGIVLNSKGKVLLINEGDGFWGFPKGRPEKDETLLETAIREVAEETGLTEITKVTELGSYQRHPVWHGVENKAEIKDITLFLFRTNQELPATNTENNECTWLAVNQVMNRLSHVKDRRFFEEAMSKVI